MKIQPGDCFSIYFGKKFRVFNLTIIESEFQTPILFLKFILCKI